MSIIETDEQESEEPDEEWAKFEDDENLYLDKFKDPFTHYKYI